MLSQKAFHTDDRMRVVFRPHGKPHLIHDLQLSCSLVKLPTVDLQKRKKNANISVSKCKLRTRSFVDSTRPQSPFRHSATLRPFRFSKNGNERKLILMPCLYLSVKITPHSFLELPLIESDEQFTRLPAGQCGFMLPMRRGSGG